MILTMTVDQSNHLIVHLDCQWVTMASLCGCSLTVAQAWFGGSVLKTLLGSMFPSIYSQWYMSPFAWNLIGRDEEHLPRIVSSDFGGLYVLHALPPDFVPTFACAP